LTDLIMETRPGQLSELFRRTERIFVHWEETMIEGYKARQLSLKEAILESEIELESRFSQQEWGGFREEKARVRERAGGAERLCLPKRERAVEPQKPDPSGREGDFPTMKTKRRETA
jgi:hypothetical protein